LLKLGIGTLWQDNGLQSSTSSSSCQYGANTRATSEYRRISGCSSATIPIERDGGSGTACGHWDDECFKGEIMTGYASGNMAMSTMTLASLEDMGFTVDYSRADPYSASDMASMCKCSGATVDDGATTSTITSGGGGDLFTPVTETTPVISSNNEQSPVATKPETPEETPVGTQPEEPVATEPEEPAVEIPADVVEPAVPETAEEVTTETSSSSSNNRGEIAAEDATNTTNDSTEHGGRHLKRQRRQLSASGEAAAREFGMSILQGNQANKNPGSGAGSIYVGSEMVVVIYEEAGEVYHILVN